MYHVIENAKLLVYILMSLMHSMCFNMCWPSSDRMGMYLG